MAPYWSAALMVWGLSWAAETPEELLDRFRTRMKVNLERLPDYTCAMAIDRYGRSNSEKAWERIDALNLEVAMLRTSELYARAGARRFEARPLVDLITRGSIGTGQFGLLARQVFLPSNVKFGFERDGEQNGRKALEFHFEIAPSDSVYAIRNAGAEAVVGILGTFWVEEDTLDLVRLEVRAYDFPAKLGLTDAVTVLDYKRQPVGGGEFLLPASGSLHLSSRDGQETLNRVRLTSCRQYHVESTLVAGETETATAEKTAEATSPSPSRVALAPGTLVEVALASPLDPMKVQAGEPVLARVVKIKDNPGLVGARLTGRVVRVERELTESPVYQLCLAFDRMEIDGTAMALNATLETAGPATGLIRQAKRMDPTFQKNSKGRLDVLVREVRRGQGILLWEARRGPIPEGLKMTWRVVAETQ